MKSLDDKPQQKIRAKIITIKSVALKLLYGMLILYLAVWAFSPIVARSLLDDWLKEHYQLEISETSSIRYNPFTSHLSIRNLSLKKTDNIVLELKRIDLELRFHRLMMKQIFISEFEVEGLSLTINKNQHIFEVAGISINEKPSSEVQVEQKKDEQSSYEVYAKAISFKNNQAIIKLNNGEHVFLLEQLLLSDVIASSQKQEFSTLVSAKINQAPIELNAELKLNNNIGNIIANIRVENFELSSISDEISNSTDNIAGKLSLESKLELTLQDDGINIRLPTTVVELNNLYLLQAEQTFVQNRLDTSINQLQLHLGDNGTKKLMIESFETIGDELLIKQDNLLLNNSSNKFSLKSLVVDVVSEKLSNTSIEQLEFSVGNIEGGNNNLEFDSSGSAIKLKQLSFNSNAQLNIEQIDVDGLNGKFLLKKQENTTLKKPPTIANAKNEETTEIIKKKPSDSLIIKVNQIIFVNSKPLVFTDETSAPHFTKQIQIEQLKLSNLDGSNPEQESPFILKGSSDEYSKFQLSGFIKPFTKKLNLKLSGQITELSLPPMNNYINQLLGFKFASGDLDLSVDIEIKDSEIEGNTFVKIRGLELSSSKNYNQNVITEQTSLPLNMVLGTLKNGDGNLELDIPMLGNVESPTFGVSSFVTLITKKAIHSAAKNYLLKTFVPYAELITMTISAGDFIMKVRFEDLPYENKQTAISEKQMKYMQQFIKLMNEKPETQVKVCALATIEELSSDERASFDKPQTIASLMKLSKLRMELFKKYVAEKSISSSRVLLCSPEIDLSEGSKPKISIAI